MRKSLLAGLIFCFALEAADLHITEAQAKGAATVKPVPEYPTAARQLHITGKVELEIVIDETGKVADVKVSTGNAVLTRPCVKTVTEWRFQPFKNDGVLSRAVAPLTFEFR